MPIHALLTKRDDVTDLDARIAAAEAAEKRPIEKHQAARVRWGDALAAASSQPGADHPEPPAPPHQDLLQQLRRITVALRDSRRRLLADRSREITLDLQGREQEIVAEVRSIAERLAELGAEACSLAHAAEELDRSANLPPGARRHFYGDVGPAGVLKHVAAGKRWIAG